MNAGTEAIEIRAIHPATVVRMDLTERNPAPGTEDRPPSATTYDLGTGRFEWHGPTRLPGD